MLCRFWWNPLSGITKQLLIFDSVLVPLGCWSQRSNPCPANSHNYCQFHSCIKATPKTRRRRRSNINNKQQTQGCWTQMFSLFGFSLGAFERRNSWFSSKWLFGACCYQNQVWSSLCESYPVSALYAEQHDLFNLSSYLEKSLIMISGRDGMP